ncbi:MAG: gamma-glutamyl-gamma-aminobutyrate hydrolase family protein, partial [Erysipelotrichaceae bacterium]|nr:gamma-glutamyl-gamma-aminobutyrate hydrolase family protein [Erysipelotrichaceae bacterium]
DPVNYGEELRPETNLYDFEVYSQDKAAIHAFNRLGKPILGICAGIQVINVVFGGSLHQHIEGHRDATHHVRLTRDSLLYRIYGKEDIMTNSYHHQCVNRVADGFKVTAMSEDGIIEGIEKDNILAVQWHPEISHDYDFFINWLKLSQTD